LLLGPIFFLCCVSRCLGGGWVFAVLFDGFLCFSEVPSTYLVADSCW
jgi:hypothetical protein